MIDDIIVIDNVIDLAYQHELEMAFLGEMNAAWYLLNDVAYPGAAVKHQQPGIVHPLYESNQGILSPLYNLALPMMFKALADINFKYQATVRGRGFIQFPTGTNHVNHAHVDASEAHLVCLYYVNDSDGDTVIYDQTVAEIPNLPGLPQDTFTVNQTISPRRGRVVLFDGLRYHSSTTPIGSRRCVVNFDVTGSL
jgi:hypothetical protein